MGIACACFVGVFASIRFATRVLPNTKDSAGRLTLPNAWRLSPAGDITPLPGDMPMNVFVTKDGKYALVNTSGYHGQSLSVVDLASQKIVQTVDLHRDAFGLALDENTGEVYVSGAAQEARKKSKRSDTIAGADQLPDDDAGPILRLKFEDGHLESETPIAVPEDPADTYVSGLAVLNDGSLCALNIQTDMLYRLSKDDHSVIGKVKLGYRPYGIAQSPDGSTLSISNWGDSSVTFLHPADLSAISTVKVGSQPCSLVYSADGRLFVTNSGSNSVSVLSGGKVAETIRTSLNPKDPIGSTPNAVCVDEKDKRLFITNADNNDVAVVDISRPGSSRVLGFIPTGRYPSAIGYAASTGKILIGIGKGLTSAANADHTYISDLLQGDLAFVEVPSGRALAAYTDQVRQDLPVGAAAFDAADKANALNAFKKIKHVVYVIRENRTYDQVLGDVAEGNGDAQLTLFGQKFTPNSHQLVHDFVLLDNLYCDGECSQVGHQWTDADYVTDYEEKETFNSYSGRGEIKSDPRLTASPGEYLWEDARTHGRTSRIFGEYVEWQEDHNSAHGAVKADPEKFGCSAEFEKIFARGGRDTEKVGEFLKEMHAAESTGKWPNFMVMALPEDHTQGARPGRHTPGACVANNDLALGRLIDGISHGKFWKDTAVFIIEDDAQDGADHVDCHRTVGLVVSPYVRRHAVDSTLYSTSSMIRTIELILGLPPMTQYDAHATPMFASFIDQPDLTPFATVAPQTDVDAMNPDTGDLARRSMALDFSDIDRADPKEFNSILWACMRNGAAAPAPVRSLRIGN